MVSSFDGHSCVSCNLYTTVFLAKASRQLKDKEAKKKKRAAQKVSSESPSVDAHAKPNNTVCDNTAHNLEHPNKPSEYLDDCTPFPPPPLTSELTHTIVRDFCAASQPSELEEAGCAVCGRLVPIKLLSPLKHIKRMLHILEAPGVTRMERMKASQPIREHSGPVLDYSCNRVCDNCRGSIRKGKVPDFALANGLWIGKVPEVLSSLNFMEKLLVARVRHTCCFARVASSGLHKMRAHLVAFESPVPKVYDLLPPPVEDLDDVLAILFTGSCMPTEDDLKRTPVLVRRKAVRAALEWLKLNHPDYENIGISDDNLSRYPEDKPVVSVVYRESLTNKIAEATSVHDNGDEEGVNAGECPFVVHGLTGDQLGAQSVETLKGIAMKHWKSGGRALRVGHSGKMESIYNNPDLYPQMFPWLFPYGLGGVGSTRLSDPSHKKYLLLYHDKRFQTDLSFPFAAFSHQQIKAANTGGYLVTNRANFQDMTDRLLNVNQDVLEDIAKRMGRGDVVKPETDDEKLCFQVIRDLDHVGGKVDGSVTSKKYMRNEIWSVVASQGAPSWYITLSPSDVSHPICLYYADGKEKFEPVLRPDDERFRLIAKNPVAAARFFDFMVKSFIKHILGCDSDHPGLYGDTSAYYGTVEQQGRLTLHLHLLLWIKNGLTPEDARREIMNPDSPFQRDLVKYLEAAHQGEFSTGTMDEVSAAIDAASKSPDYQNPTQTLPEQPPKACPEKCQEAACERCESLTSWWARFKFTVDDILFKSNVHTCRSTINKDGSQNRLKQYAGCLDNKWGVCRARFPRPLFKQTEVDPATGSLHIKKLESWLNTVSGPLTYLFRCNTDVTSLRSGTAIKSVLYYVTKYVTKSSLKTSVIFDTVRSIFHKNTEVLGGSASRKEKARSLMTKIVNSLSVKSEMGSPMMCLYLLHNPDHYTSHKFRPFYWQSFVTEALSSWPTQNVNDDHRIPEKVMLMQRDGRLVGLSPVYDYIYRDPELETMSLYDWISRCHREKGETDSACVREDVSEYDGTEANYTEDEGSPKGGGVAQKKTKTKKRAQTTVHSFLEMHPLSSTHRTVCRDANHGLVPNFIGRPLPRCDKGDREYYCATMLALFKPWRSGLDLKQEKSSWDETFVAENFAPRHRTLMKNFNIQYECMDAQDDFHAQLKKGKANLPSWMDDEAGFMAKCRQDQQIDDFMFEEGPAEGEDELEFDQKLGAHRLSILAAMREMSGIMRDNNWHNPEPALLPDDTDLNPKCPDLLQSGSEWKASVMKERTAILEERAKNLPGCVNTINRKQSDPNVVEIVDRSYLDRKCRSEQWSATIQDIMLDFNLNKEQQRAFSIVANHAARPDSDQLKMYIGGMGGTGKTQVLKALMKYFDTRQESHRLVVVAPTGTAASLLGGSTYHYMFGISDLNEGQNNTRLAQVKSRLTGVDYVFFDEVSMLACRDLYQISARLAHVLGNAETPFGGMNMIFAGDFAQLPPAMGGEGVSLYSRTVGTRGISLRDQEAAIGKALWHQITTVVILRQNMRQTSQSAEDTKLRKALENMRYKSCTPDDLIFLRSRISSTSPGRPCITEKQFRNISVITGFNRDKDAINQMGSHRFAEETSQTLTDFYSEDLETPLEDEENRKQRKAAANKTSVKKRMLSEREQRALWESPHCENTKQIPGKLSLCIGLPVMIRQNSATELCMTRGQEGFVHSWQSSKGARGQRVLDTLFVRLSNPPKTVQLEGLPENVVPITRTTVATICFLPDGTTRNMARTQVEVLPNFAMTDYASQGKTREFNVTHLNSLRSHQAYYTALSRGSSAKGSLILQGFDPKKMTGGASGALRQEFRELEILDDITHLRYEGRLPRGVYDADRRNTLIDSFRGCKGQAYIPRFVHPAIRWGKSDPFLDWVLKDINWRIITKPSAEKSLQPMSSFIPARGTNAASKAASKGSASSLMTKTINDQRLKRKSLDNQTHDHLLQDMPKLKKSRIEGVASAEVLYHSSAMASPIGTVWEGNSCAYDVVIVILRCIWSQDPERETELLANINYEYLGPIVNGFVDTAASAHLEGVRDMLRRALYAESPMTFPWCQYTSVHSIFDYILASTTQVMSAKLTCTRGHHVNRAASVITSCHLFPICSGNTSLQAYIRDFRYQAGSRCRTCQSPLVMVNNFTHAPHILAFDLTRGYPFLDWVLNVPVLAQGVQTEVAYRLAGVVYHGYHHFTCRVITPGGAVWNHDGMTTGRLMEPESASLDIRALKSLRGRIAIVAVYVKRT